MSTARGVIGLVLLVLFASSTSASAAQAGGTPQSPQHQHPGSQQEATTPGMQGKMTTDCQSMMAQHQKMMEEMNGMDARLDMLVQAMNSATGTAKVDAIGSVVVELVSQRKAMRERMSGMQAGMMQHMMEHTQAAGAQGVMQCPMMKDMGHPTKH